MCLGTPERSVFVVVQLANRSKVRVEVHVQRYPDGDTPSICVAVHADLRIADGMLLNLLS